MKPDQTIAQLRLAADLLETGHPWEYRDVGKTEWRKGLSINSIISSPVEYEIRPILATPPDGRALHNPHNLTAEQVGVGYRLLLSGETLIEGYQYWSQGAWHEGGMFLGKKVPEYNAFTSCRLPLSVPWPKAPKPVDPYAELKKAHAEGKVIQIKGITGVDDYDWKDCDPQWAPNREYRIKPEPAFQLPPCAPGNFSFKQHENKFILTAKGFTVTVDCHESN